MTPKISVLLASYNHAPFVREAVESVLTQSFADFELVITDDGSVDGTADVIRGISDPRICFHAFPENRGACVALNDAIGRARGEYVAVLNSDDYFLPGKLERQVAFLDMRPDIGAVFGLPRFVDERGALLPAGSHAFAKLFTAENLPRHGWLRHFFLNGNCLCHPTVMLRRSCYDVVGLFDPLLMQLPDLDMWVRLCTRFDVHIQPEEVTAFRVLGRERNVSAPSLLKRVRSAWELPTVLAHYAVLPDAEIRAVFADLPGIEGMPVPALALALEAIRIDQPGYRQFGLGLLRDCMRRDARAFPCRDYFQLVGKIDPCAVRFSGQVHRCLADSRLFATALKAAHWLCTPWSRS